MKFEDIRNIAMIGSGTMGAGMSWCFAQAGYNVKLYDVNPQQLERACTRIRSHPEAVRARRTDLG